MRSSPVLCPRKTSSRRMYPSLTPAPPPHELLDLFGLDWDIRHQIDWPVVGDLHVVLEPHSKTFVWNIDPRFDGQHATGAKRLAGQPDVVHIQPKEVPQPVREVFPGGGFIFGLLFDV